MKKIKDKLLLSLSKKNFYKILSLSLIILIMIFFSIFISLFVDSKYFGHHKYSNFDINSPLRILTFSQETPELTFGNAQAPVTIYLYNDYNSPYAKKFYNGVFKKIIEEYVDTNEVKIIVKTSCNGKDHTDTLRIANALYCADELGKGYGMYIQIYENKKTDIQSLINYSTKIELDEKIFEQCMFSQKYDLVIMDEIDQNKRIESVPTMIIGKEIIVGPKPYIVYKKAIENSKLI